MHHVLISLKYCALFARSSQFETLRGLLCELGIQQRSGGLNW
jgi:hypothetical protein